MIGRYERDEMTPSIAVAKNLAHILHTTVGYLLGETKQENMLKNPEMLNRLNDIEDMNDEDRKHVIFTIDALIQKVKIKRITA